ncbi:MAG: hypothetical protein KAH17_06510 [Bacteroidales bacterium]|nr:hypothetical protein [Bacteroidales bacterium]
MIRLEKYTSLIIGVLLLCGVHTNAQNLYDAVHSKAFAHYLLSSKQYALAAMELERIVFMEANNEEAKENLIIAYRKADDWPTGIDKIKSWYPQSNPDSTLAEEWIKLLLLNHDFPKAQSYLNDNPKLLQAEVEYYRLATYMLKEDFLAADYLINNQYTKHNSASKELSYILKRQQAYGYKNPGVALGLSALIPGLGKAYTKDWKDGLISLLFVATNAWQAYRGFSNDGIQSVYGWIFGSMAVGFYGSNLYGSWKSATDYNMRLNNDLHHEIEATVYNRF